MEDKELIIKELTTEYNKLIRTEYHLTSILGYGEIESIIKKKEQQFSDRLLKLSGTHGSMENFMTNKLYVVILMKNSLSDYDTDEIPVIAFTEKEDADKFIERLPSHLIKYHIPLNPSAVEQEQILSECCTLREIER